MNQDYSFSLMCFAIAIICLLTINLIEVSIICKQREKIIEFEKQILIYKVELK